MTIKNINYEELISSFSEALTAEEKAICNEEKFKSLFISLMEESKEDLSTLSIDEIKKIIDEGMVDYQEEVKNPDFDESIRKGFVVDMGYEMPDDIDPKHLVQVLVEMVAQCIRLMVGIA